MSPEVVLLNEVWEVVREHIPKKERVHVAETMLRCFEENLDMSDIETYKNEFDSAMKTAIVTNADTLDDDGDDWDDWE